MILAEMLADELVHEVDEGMTSYNETMFNWEAITYCGRVFRWTSQLNRPSPVEYAERVLDPQTAVTCIACIARTPYL